MIKMIVKRDQEYGYITEFTLSGHAEFADSGKDIVCAAVSGISFGTINAIHTLLNAKPMIDSNQKTGFFHCVIPQDLDTNTHEKMQLLLEGMLVSLQSVASEYGNYMTLSDKRR